MDPRLDIRFAGMGGTIWNPTGSYWVQGPTDTPATMSIRTLPPGTEVLFPDKHGIPFGSPSENPYAPFEYIRDIDIGPPNEPQILYWTHYLQKMRDRGMRIPGEAANYSTEAFARQSEAIKQRVADTREEVQEAIDQWVETGVHPNPETQAELDAAVADYASKREGGQMAMRVGPPPGGYPVLKPANEPQTPPPRPTPPPPTSPDAAAMAGGESQAFIGDVINVVKKVGGGIFGGGPEEWAMLPPGATCTDLKAASGKDTDFAYLPGFGWTYRWGSAYLKPIDKRPDTAVNALERGKLSVRKCTGVTIETNGGGPGGPGVPFGMGAVDPHTITQRRCPKGYRLAIDGRCYPKAALPAGYRMNKSKRAVVSWSEGNALRKAARAKRKLETYEKRMKKLLGTRTRTVYRDRKPKC